MAVSYLNSDTKELTILCAPHPCFTDNWDSAVHPNASEGELS